MADLVDDRKSEERRALDEALRNTTSGQAAELRRALLDLGSAIRDEWRKTAATLRRLLRWP